MAALFSLLFYDSLKQQKLGEMNHEQLEVDSRRYDLTRGQKKRHLNIRTDSPVDPVEP